MQTPIGFFDSHGALYLGYPLTEADNLTDPAPFGPTMCAVSGAWGDLGLRWDDDETAWAAAKRTGRLIPADGDGFDILADE